MKKSCPWAGRCGHKSLHVCPPSLLPQHCSQPQPSLSSLSSIDRHQRDPSPSHPSTVDRGFPFLLSVIQPLYLSLPRWPGCTKVCHRRCGCVPTRGNRLSDGFGFGLQSHPAAHISSAAQKSREMGRACDSKLGKCRNIVGSGKNLKCCARKKLFIVLSVRLV